MEKTQNTILQRRPLPKKKVTENAEEIKHISLSNSKKQKKDFNEKHLGWPGQVKQGSFVLNQDDQNEKSEQNVEMYHCLIPLGPRPFPQRTLRKPPFHYRILDMCNKTDEFINEACMLLSLLKTEQQQVLKQREIEANQLPIVPKRPIQEKEETDLSLKIINLPGEEKLPEQLAPMPWRQCLVEDRLSKLECMKEDATPLKMTTNAGDGFMLTKQKYSTLHNKIYVEGGAAKYEINRLQKFQMQLEKYIQQEDEDNKVDPGSSSDALEYDPENPNSLLRAMYKDSYNDRYGKKCYWNKKETKLNLKACFIEEFPTLPLSLFKTLVWVNLSFNNFTEFPAQLLFARNIFYMNLRNNPLTDISYGIKKLKKLRYLNLSFCCLTKINDSVFTLKNLEVLDVSYNFLQYINPEVKELRSLKELYVDGNYLRYFPTGLLTLNLKLLSNTANFTHRLFWKETVPNIPQTLTNIAATCLSKNPLCYEHMSFVKQYIENGLSKCDYCLKHQFCEGIPVMKPVSELFGLNTIPILFHVCSQTCRKLMLMAAHLPVNKLVHYRRMAKKWFNMSADANENITS